ncbi:12387_t:CDS:2 [Cetraspora pellucida]|uniref:12387_t:CDS:1 n=1 Tax=Cetraspora pellucida TaxID=1433469 RepID=A0A9N9HS03_9GLOM|nr:12387_t:CDS:2 [Cetraspora pellucida]
MSYVLEKWDDKSKSGETFNKFNYEDKELLETEGYHTEESLIEEGELYDNPWADAESPAIYLTVVEDTPTQDAGPPKSWEFFCQEKGLFVQDTKELEETSVLTHMIDTGDTKPIKQNLYHITPSEQEFVKKELKDMKERGLII